MCSTNLGFSIRMYVPGISRLPRRVCMYLVSAGRRTFRPWTHTSDDSYIYQLSLVVATATVSLVRPRTPYLVYIGFSEKKTFF